MQSVFSTGGCLHGAKGSIKAEMENNSGDSPCDEKHLLHACVDWAVLGEDS